MTDEIWTQEMNENLGSLEKRLQLVQWIMGGIAAGFLALAIAVVPWAFAIHAEVASISARFDSLEVPPKWFAADVANNTHEIDRLDERVRKLENSRPE